MSEMSQIVQIHSIDPIHGRPIHADIRFYWRKPPMIGLHIKPNDNKRRKTNYVMTSNKVHARGREDASHHLRKHGWRQENIWESIFVVSQLFLSQHNKVNLRIYWCEIDSLLTSNQPKIRSISSSHGYTTNMTISLSQLGWRYACYNIHNQKGKHTTSIMFGLSWIKQF